MLQVHFGSQYSINDCKTQRPMVVLTVFGTLEVSLAAIWHAVYYIVRAERLRTVNPRKLSDGQVNRPGHPLMEKIFQFCSRKTSATIRVSNP